MHSYKTVDVLDSLAMGFKSYLNQTLIGNMSQMLRFPSKVFNFLFGFHHLTLSLSLSGIFFNGVINQRRKKSHTKLQPTFAKSSSVVKHSWRKILISFMHVEIALRDNFVIAILSSQWTSPTG